MLQNKTAIVMLCLIFLLVISIANVFGSTSEENEQPQVTWKTFKDRDNLFTVQYPSNWTPRGIAESERSGPIDIIFDSPGKTETTGSDVWFTEYAQLSVFSTAKESQEQKITNFQNDPTVTKFEIERPIECSKYTFNGLPACSYIYEIHTTDGQKLAIMAVNAIAQDGTEYEMWYRSDFNLFQHFLPVADGMIKSFRTTGNGSGATDFSLSSSVGTSNTTDQQNSSSSSKDNLS